MRGLPVNDPIDVREAAFGFHDDFLWFVTAHLWTSVLTDTGTAAVGDAAGGVLTLSPSDGTVADNDEAYVKTTNEVFLFADNKPAEFNARAKFTEAATNAANVALGFASAVAADTLQDNGGGPPASYSGAVFFKYDGVLPWYFETSIGATQTTTQIADVATAGDGTYRKFTIEVRPRSTTVVEVIPFIDDVQCRDSNGNPIKHTIDATSATEMNAFMGVKNGTGAQQTLLVDYANARQLR